MDQVPRLDQAARLGGEEEPVVLLGAAQLGTVSGLGLPPEVEHLLQVVAIKALSRVANVEKVEAGPKGVVLAFRDNTFANPEALIKFIRDSDARVRPDQKVVFFADWEKSVDRLKGTAAILRKLASIGEPAKAA